MGKLSDWAKDNSQFIILDDEESVEIVYKGFKFVSNRFDPEKETVRYIFLVEGAEKYWETPAGYVARFFDEVKEGEPVKIIKQKEGVKPRYKLELIIK